MASTVKVKAATVLRFTPSERVTERVKVPIASERVGWKVKAELSEDIVIKDGVVDY